MDAAALLERKLHSLTVEELKFLKRIADDVFEPLVRPFRQSRTEDRFDFRQTIRTAVRRGDFMPAYTPVRREHRKSTLVIAMSLSGIDRCAAVSLIPLFAELRSHLDFRLLIYTDDAVEAKFTRDGFLENDIDIAWNNVAGPVVFRRIGEMNFARQEDTLLVIDNLGGGDSKWYSCWDQDDRKEVIAEQWNYLKPSDTPAGFFTKIRDDLNGDFDALNRMPASRLPLAWRKVVERNCSQRWVETPAMKEYLARWLFHPEFGRKEHGAYVVGWQGLEVNPALRSLKRQFQTVHWMRTAVHGAVSDRLDSILRLNVVDYLHEADTIADFATVLANIVHGKSTNKLTRDEIRFSDFIDEPVEFDKSNEGEEHADLVAGKGGCFSRAVAPKNALPEKTKHFVPYRKRGATELSEEGIAFHSVDLGEWFPYDLSQPGNYHAMINLTPDWNIRAGMSRFSMLQEANNVLDHIRSWKIVPQVSDYPSLTKKERPEFGITSNTKDEDRAHYGHHGTEELQVHVDDYLSLYSDDYRPFYNHCPLTNVVFCGDAHYQYEHLGFTVSRNDVNDWRRQVFHEAGHHVEHAVPAVGAFTNHLVRQKTGGADAKKLVAVHGGRAMPVTDGSTPWVKPYAGKWYERDHADLPVGTEVVSVHGEYFRSPEELLKLMTHDPFMVKFMAFVFMGGPVAAFASMRNAKHRQALEDLQQKNLRDLHGGYVPTGGRRGRPAGSGWGRSSRTSRVSSKDKSGSFGV